MEIKDLVITPIYLLFFLSVSYGLRSLFTDKSSRAFFIPALSAKFAGAIIIGLIYQYYYGGGDTFSYHTHGSRLIWQAFMDNPVQGFRLIFLTDKSQVYDLHEYTQKIWYFRNLGTSYNVCRFAGFIDIFTWSTYSSTALFFALWSFSGWWKFFSVIIRHYPNIQPRYFALAIFFIPSVVIWGSGIFKDSLTLGALGWIIWFFFCLLEEKKATFSGLLIVLFSLYILYLIKLYILLSLIPFIIYWAYLNLNKRIENQLVKAVLKPILAISFVFLVYNLIEIAASANERYSLENLAETARITAYDIRYGWGARYGENSGYSLGDLDGTFGGMIKLFPSAVNVTLFRPYLWEVRNIFMLMSAIESLVFSILVLKILFNSKAFLSIKNWSPFITSAVAFLLVFSFAVGVSTYNFGTLVRYKIPILPLFGILIVLFSSKKRKVEEFQ